MGDRVDQIVTTHIQPLWPTESSILLRKSYDSREWQLQEMANIDIYRIPEGFVTDRASIPVWLWWFVHPDDPGVDAAALVHDFLYVMGRERGYVLANQERLVDAEGRPLDVVKARKKYVDRITADREFRRLLLSGGVPKWRAEIMYRAVRLFGGVVWRRGLRK